MSRKYFFHDCYIPEPNSGCWLWFGPINEDGYGRYWNGNRRVGAHRHSWVEHRGVIPLGLHVLHKCDVPCCVNPEHLFLGTHLDNIADMKAKRRARGCARSGFNSSNAAFTPEQMDYLRTRRASGSKIIDLAAEFSVHRDTVSRALSGKTYPTKETA